MCNLRGEELSVQHRQIAGQLLLREARREAAKENPVLRCKLQKLFRTV